MRFFYFILLVIITIVEVGPVPLTPVLLIWVVLFRPIWFYDLVQKIYSTKIAVSNHNKQ